MMGAALLQGAEIAIRHLQASDQITAWVDPAKAARIMVGEYERQLRAQL